MEREELFAEGWCTRQDTRVKRREQTHRLGSMPAERMAASARVLQSEKKEAQEAVGGAPVAGRRSSASGTSQAGSHPPSSKSAGGGIRVRKRVTSSRSERCLRGAGLLRLAP